MPLKIIFSTLSASIERLLIYLLIFSLAVYRIVATVCLRGRILAPMDIIWDLDKDAELPFGIITCMTMLSGGKITLPEFRIAFREKCIPFLDSKFLSLRKRSLFGYQYWQKYENFNLDDHVKGLRNDEIVEEDEMRQILEKLSDEKLPCNHQSEWEFYLGPHLKSKDGIINQTVIWRLHHSLGDGPALLRLAMSAFVKSEDADLLAVPEEKVKKSFQKLPSQESMYQKVVEYKTLFFKKLRNNPRDETTYLHEIPSLDKRMQIAWRCSSEMMQAAKSIRKSTGASFSTALIATFLDALAHYRGYEDAFKNVTFFLPFHTKYEKNAKLGNYFTYNYATFTMPEKNRDTIRHLEAVNQNVQKSKSLADLTINGLFVKFSSWMSPRPLCKILFTLKEAHVVFSNIPGPEAEFSYGNLKMDKVVCFPARTEKNAIGVIVCSYKGALNVGLNVDTAICKGPNGAEEIMQLWEKRLCQMAQEITQRQ